VKSTTVSFPSVMKPKYNQPVGERNNSRRLLLADFATASEDLHERVVDLAPAAMWNLHTTQPRYSTPTCSEVVNLTGLLKTKD
jgi:hypothetical protein